MTQEQLSWSEDRLQQEVIMWFSQEYTKYHKLLFAVPNGGARSGLQAKILKATGVKRGVSDLILTMLGGPYYIELKKPRGGIQSKDQLEFEQLVKDQGFEYVIMNDLDKIKSYITEKMSFAIYSKERLVSSGEWEKFIKNKKF